MMLGDSITATTCYPQLVYQDLKSAGHANFTFIGSIVNNQSCGVAAPAGGFLTEGHSGKLVVTETSSGNVLSWFNGGQSTATNIINAYSTILTQLRSVNPNAIMFVAQIIPVNPSMNNCSSANPCNFEATVDSVVPAWATSHSTAASPVFSVNLETLYNNGYFPGSTYTSDGVHPTLTGSQPMGSTMSAAIIAKGYF
jgi:lysophospholipase L1-like esterase